MIIIMFAGRAAEPRGGVRVRHLPGEEAGARPPQRHHELQQGRLHLHTLRQLPPGHHHRAAAGQAAGSLT